MTKANLAKAEDAKLRIFHVGVMMAELQLGLCRALVDGGRLFVIIHLSDPSEDFNFVVRDSRLEEGGR